MSDGTRYIENWNNGILLTHIKIESAKKEMKLNENNQLNNLSRTRKMHAKPKYHHSCLEELDSYQAITSLLLQNPFCKV